MRRAQPRAPHSFHDSWGSIDAHHPASHPAARLVICSIAVGRLSCCQTSAQTSEIQRAALHTTGVAAGPRAGERQLASRPILSHPTGPRHWNAKGAHPHLLTVMQGELQSDVLDAALEETKAKVEKRITVSDRLGMAECRTAQQARCAISLGGPRRLSLGRRSETCGCSGSACQAACDAHSRTRRSQPVSARASFMHTTSPTTVQLDMPFSIALGRLLCCGARALAGEIQRAALHMTSAAAGRTAGERQLAHRLILSHPTGLDVEMRVVHTFTSHS